MQSSHSYSQRPHPGYQTDLDHKYFGMRSLCIYNNIFVLLLRRDLEVCSNICCSVKACLECRTHAFWIKDKLGFLSRRAVNICWPLVEMQPVICEQLGAGAQTHSLVMAAAQIATCWMRWKNYPSAYSPCKASRSWTFLCGKLS